MEGSPATPSHMAADAAKVPHPLPPLSHMPRAAAGLNAVALMYHSTAAHPASQTFSSSAATADSASAVGSPPRSPGDPHDTHDGEQPPCAPPTTPRPPSPAAAVTPAGFTTGPPLLGVAPNVTVTSACVKAVGALVVAGPTWPVLSLWAASGARYGHHFNCSLSEASGNSVPKNRCRCGATCTCLAGVLIRGMLPLGIAGLQRERRATAGAFASAAHLASSALSNLPSFHLRAMALSMVGLDPDDVSTPRVQHIGIDAARDALMWTDPWLSLRVRHHPLYPMSRRNYL